MLRSTCLTWVSWIFPHSSEVHTIWPFSLYNKGESAMQNVMFYYWICKRFHSSLIFLLTTEGQTSLRTWVQNVLHWHSSKEKQQKGLTVNIHTIQPGRLQRAKFSSCSLVIWKLQMVVLTLAFPSSPSGSSINLWYLLKFTACLRTLRC